MSKKWITLLVIAVVMALVPASAFADCAAAVVGKLQYGAVPAPGDPAPATAAQGATLVTYATTGTPANLAVEGRTERISDVLVWEDGQANYQCFKTNNNIRITYNAGITSSPAVTAPSTTYFDVYDTQAPNGLAITATTTLAQVPGGGTQTVVIVTVQQAGTYTVGSCNVAPPVVACATTAGSAFRIKNLRVDATTLVTAPQNALVNVTNSAGAMTGPITVPTNIVGVSRASFTNNASLGISDAIGGAVGTFGSGLQNSGGGLSTQARFNFAEAAAATMKTPGGTCLSQTPTSDTCDSQIANDIATNAMSVIFDAGTSLPSGVSVSWPTTLSNSGQTGIAAGAHYTWALRNAPTCSGPATPCFAIYDRTFKDTVPAVTTFTVDTAAAAAGTPTTAANPAVGVAIAGTSGAGTVTLHGFFGPSEAASSCPNDDVNASAVPRYISTCTGTAGSGSVPTRNLFSGTWFKIISNQTALLLPYATNLFNYQTGIVVSNTSAHGAAFTAATPQKGGLKFYFFPTNGTAFTLNTDVTTGGVGAPANTRGLDANGQLSGGGIFAGSLNALLTAAGQPANASFDGYIIIVAGFQFAHGQVAVVSPNGTAAYSNLNVIQNSGGGRVVNPAISSETLSQ